MSLIEKYELLDVIAENETRTYLARERSTVRMVMIHLLLPNPNRIALLEMVLRTRMMPSSPGRQQILDLGEHEGMPYVATEIIPGFRTLREWLEGELAYAARGAGSVIPQQAGTWPVPVTPEQAPPPTSSPAPTVAPPQWPSAVPPPAATAAPPSPQPSAEPPSTAPASPKRDPGEFTQLFQVVMADLDKPVAPPVAAAEPPPVSPPAAGSPEPGLSPGRPPESPTPEIFSAPVTPPTPAPSEPGEFTRMFQTGWQAAPPPPAVPVGAPPAAGLPPGPEPGEFTRMFQQGIPTPAAPQPPVGPPPAFPQPPSAPLPAGPEPGEFTRMFQSPLAPSPLPPQVPSPAATPATPPVPPEPMPWVTPGPAGLGTPPTGGEFTRIFGSPAGTPAAAPPPALAGAEPGGATQLFTSPVTPPTPPLPPSGGPGEYTRMVAAEAPAAPAPTPQPAAAFPTARPAPAKPATSPYLPLYLILGFVLLIGLLLILYFALRH